MSFHNSIPPRGYDSWETKVKAAEHCSRTREQRGQPERMTLREMWTRNYQLAQCGYLRALYWKAIE